MTPLTPLLAGAALLLVVQSLSAGTLVSDSFETSDHPTGDRTVVAGGGSGIQFYTRNATGPNYSVNIVDDSGTGGLGSMALQSNDTINSGPVICPIIGLLPQAITLALPNDFIQLDFKFRYTNVEGLPPSSTASSNGSGFRFGLYGSFGTPVSADAQTTGVLVNTTCDDDRGYCVQAGVLGNPTTTTTLYHERGGTYPILGGGDRDNFTTVAGPGFSTNAVHTASLKLTRGTGTNVALSLSYDGGSAITATDTSGYFTFDEIAFSDATAPVPLIFNLDNIVVTTNLVPEPETATFLAIAAAGRLGFSRRRKSVN
jgi:hypothetical protein